MERNWLITQAARLNEIGFPESPAKLTIDTFDALVAANLRQTQAYIELIQQNELERSDMTRVTLHYLDLRDISPADRESALSFPGCRVYESHWHPAGNARFERWKLIFEALLSGSFIKGVS